VTVNPGRGREWKWASFDKIMKVIGRSGAVWEER
jgi:hypothetical protein